MQCTHTYRCQKWDHEDQSETKAVGIRLIFLLCAGTKDLVPRIQMRWWQFRLEESVMIFEEESLL